ncbi:non-specific lipid-transfer protein 1 [Cocos nucifera]|uniref:Non-specific lipid-transfer protein 1 n=1 Tax=Cocos nucifera TaxID=13894 RepID=A0A8K0HW20_COCNU|nr:non-specific lipid-transfer protein 1 [Cocos nucifera]
MASNSVRCTAWALAAVLVVVVVVSAASTGAAVAVSCGDAVNALIPCGSYLVGSGKAEPSPQCCNSARGLNRMATTVEERRALCQCFKQTGPSFGVKPDRARHLLPACKLDLNIPISPDVDCTRSVRHPFPSSNIPILSHST